MNDSEFEIGSISAHLKCEYKRESIRRKLSWVLIGAFIGSLLGFAVSQYNSHLQKERERREKTYVWIFSVIKEVDYNLEWETNSVSYKVKGDSLPFKRSLSYSALQSLLILSPDLKVDSSIDSNGRVLLEFIMSLNQHIVQRNVLNNGQVFANLDRAVKSYDDVINDGLKLFRTLALNYRGDLIRIRDDL